MKKVLIISYFYPPCELTAGRRVESWATGLSELGYDIHVLSRKWENPVKAFSDIHQETSPGILRKKQDGYRITFVPYRPNLRDRLLNNGNLSLIRKALSIKEALFQPLFLKQCPFVNIHSEAKKILEKEKIDLIIISGNPFIQFKFGFELNKQFGIPWIADYRDAWTTSTINHIGRSFWYKIFMKYERNFEKKWVSTASLVTASSEEIGKSIEQLTGIKSKAIYNGFNMQLFENFKNVKKKQDQFQIAYIGTLYDGQDISIFLKGFRIFIEKNSPNVKLLFPGLIALPSQMSRVQSMADGIESYIEFSDRIPLNEILKIEKESHLLVHVAWAGQKGIIASKIYEYIGSGTQILIAPGDNSDIDSIILKSGNGSICNSPEEVASVLDKKHQEFMNNEGEPINKIENQNIFEFTREAQVKKLNQELTKILEISTKILNRS